VARFDPPQEGGPAKACRDHRGDFEAEIALDDAVTKIEAAVGPEACAAAANLKDGKKAKTERPKSERRERMKEDEEAAFVRGTEPGL
jgi:hypothetical protein